MADEPLARRHNKVAPAVGLRLNRILRTNLAIDYARGIQGSSSLSFNVGGVI